MVLVVGLDGLDMNLVTEWLGELPGMASLIKRSSWGFLKSSEPPMSIPAWQYFYTGKQSGKHGVFHFYQMTSGGKTRIHRSSDLSSETLWSILDRAGISCGVLSVPGTYPPSTLKNGYMLSGWPFGVQKNCTHPPELENELSSLVSSRNYRDPYPNPLSPEDDDVWVKKIFDGIDVQTKIVKYLLENKPVSVFVVVFYSLDRASHRLFYNKKLLKECYVKQDEALREIIKVDSKDRYTILMSDHGFVERESLFFANTWLKQNNYLILKKERLLRRTLRNLGITGSGIMKAARRMPINVEKLFPKNVLEHLWDQMPHTTTQTSNIRSQGISILDVDIDWEKTKAYSAGFWQIFINRKIVRDQKDYEKTREEIISRLRKLFLAENRRLRFYRKEDLFSGPFKEEGPDIVFRTNDEKCIPAPTFASSHDQRLFKASKWGDHSQNGVIMISGPTVKKNHEIKANILDVCPTILHISEVPLPNDLDGKPIKEIFKRDSLLYKKRELRKKIETTKKKPHKYSKTEKEMIKEKLHQLGYL